jgi:hypothetical protein
VLDRELPALGVHAAQAHQRRAAEGLIGGAVVQRLEQARHQGDFEPERLAAAYEVDQPLVGLGRERDHDVLGPGQLRDPVELVGRAEDRDPRNLAAALQRVGVQEPDGGQAVLGAGL